MSLKSAKIVGSKPAAAAPLDARVAVGVVAPALVRVAEDAVGLGRLLEALLGLLVAGVAVGVVLEGELAVGGLDLLLRGVARDAEHLVVVALAGGTRGAGRRFGRGQRAATRPAHGRSMAWPMMRGGLLHVREPRLAARRDRAVGPGLLGPLDRVEDALLLVGGQLALEGLHRAHRVRDEAVELADDRLLVLAGLLLGLAGAGLGDEAADLGLAEAARGVDHHRLAAAGGLVLGASPRRCR